MKLLIIKTKDKIYISDNIENKFYFSSGLNISLFDGEKAKRTHKESWYELNKIPTKIEIQEPNKNINTRYELKEEYPETKLTPKVIIGEYLDNEDSDYYDVRGLYEFKYDVEEGQLKEVEFETVILYEDNNFEIKTPKFPISISLLDQIQINPVLHITRPCKLSSEEFYKKVREYIKTNINGQYARVTSDYDFCFTVEKVIKLNTPTSYESNLNIRYPRRKPKYETRFNKDKKLKIFEMAPKPYNNYPVIEPLIGENYDDLENKLDAYLKELITKINEPIKECSHCDGTGVILE